jgi:hypothetical protein
MKHTIRTLIITALLIGAGNARLQAGDEALAAFGGFVAGIITGAIIEDSHDVHGGVAVEIGHRHGRHDRYDRHVRHSRHHDRGHWEVQRVRVWVPGRWEFTVSRCGDRIRVWKPGHYSWHSEKVWVSHRGRGHSRGYCG